MKTVLLDGEWRGSGVSPVGETLRFSARVPGCVHTDLLRAGLIEDPFWRDQAEKCQWIESWSWQFERAFDADRAPGAFLLFEGLDVYCDVFLNGVLLGRCDDMFVPWRFPVDGVLKEKGNVLRVAFDSPVARVAGRPVREGAFTTERLYTRRMQCTYSWDWVTRLVTCGIWKSVKLCREDETELESVYLYTAAVDAFGAQVKMEAAFSAVGAGCFLDMRLLSPEGACVLHRRRAVVEKRLWETFDVAPARLWFPNGFGDAPLYRLALRVERDGRILSEREERFGIRTLRVLQAEDAPGSPYHEKCLQLKHGPHVSGKNAAWDRNETFSGFTVLVNGQPVFCKGACWVPCEPFPSAETKEKTENLLELARDAGMNMLRVWGGGIFEHDWFYDACDRLGILVTQDFLMACGNYPDGDKWFRDALAREAEHAALALRNHPCLAWWSGDNENAVAADDDMPAYPGRKTVREAIEPTVRRLDPSREFLPSSPYGGVPYGSVTRGTSHNTQFIGEKFSYIRFGDLSEYREYFEKYLARFAAEEPIMGAPMLCTLRRFMTDADIFGPDSAQWRYHTKNNPAEDFRAFELFDYLEAIAEKVLGAFRGARDRLMKLQYIQYEWVRVTMELFRRNKGFSWGLLYWMLDDCWPASGWALIDYYALPKAGYYAFRRAAKGVVAALDKAEGAYRVTVCNDTLQEARGEGTLRLVSFAGEGKTWRFSYKTAQNSARVAFRLPAGEAEAALCENAVLVCDIAGDRAVFMEKSPAFLRFPPARVTMERTGAECLRVHADAYVHAVMLDGPFVFSDNCFPLLAGETKEIRFRRPQGQPDGEISLQWLGFEANA